MASISSGSRAGRRLRPVYGDLFADNGDNKDDDDVMDAMFLDVTEPPENVIVAPVTVDDAFPLLGVDNAPLAPAPAPAPLPIPVDRDRMDDGTGAGMLPPPATMAPMAPHIILASDTQAVLNNWTALPRVCIACHKVFLEGYNIGQWQCLQPVYGMDNRNPMVYRKQRHMRYVAADHRSEFQPIEWNNADDLSLSSAILDHLPVRPRVPSHVPRPEHANTVVVRRYDWRAAEEFENSLSVGAQFSRGPLYSVISSPATHSTPYVPGHGFICTIGPLRG